FSSLSSSFVDFLAKIGINTGEKSILAVGMVVILLIAISGLIMLEKADSAGSKEEEKTEEESSQSRAFRKDAEIIHQILNEKLVDLQKKLDQVSQYTHSLSGENETLIRLAAKDALTGLYNHAYIKERLKQELYRSQRYRHTMSVLMIDIDNFKSINDSNSHPLGDRVLRTVSMLMQQNLRPSDIIGRYGGEEFFVILPQTSSENARLVAERIRRVIETHDFKLFPSKNRSAAVTLSIGICSYPDDGINSEDILACADESLYIAKKEGKNRVIVYQSSGSL
ncbi:MAG: GGDEF domain-containing protein, partial [Candidatus Aminicenantes bacterium]